MPGVGAAVTDQSVAKMPIPSGIGDALAYATDRADLCDQMIGERLDNAIDALVRRLEPVLREANPEPPSSAASGTSPESPSGSDLAVRVAELGRRFDSAYDRVGYLVGRIDRLVGRIDLP